MKRRIACVLIAFLAGACSGPEKQLAPLPKVAPTIVPSEIASGGIKLYPKDDPETRTAFAGGGRRTLVADAKLWELRQGDRLVGALQVSTVVPKLKLERRDHRESLLRQILPGTVGEIDVADTHVWATASNDKVVYVWFGKDVFEVLQLKGSRLEPENVLTQLLTFQTASPEWKPLPISLTAR